MRSAAEVLRAAKEIIGTPDKWGQGQGENLRVPAGRLCVAQAVWCVRAPLDTQQAALYFFRQAVGIRGRIGTVDYNDTPGRTHAEIMESMDKAIELAASRR